MPYADKKKKPPPSSPKPLLDIESSYDSTGQGSGFVPNPQSTFNPLQPLRAGSECSDTGVVFGVDGSPTKSEKTAANHHKAAQPVLETGQTGSPRVSPAAPEKGKATVTGSQAEALTSDAAEHLYAKVDKQRKNTRTSLDYGRRRAGQDTSVSPPPKDWVVVAKEDAAGSDGEPVTAAAPKTTKVSAMVNKFPDPIVVSSGSPKRVVSSSSLVTSGESGREPLSSSWVDLRSMTNQGRDDGNHPPPVSPRQPDTSSKPGASLEGRVASYRVLYSFMAEQETEISLNEGDVISGIPGELPSNGWLMVEVKGQRGLVPESYLEVMGEGGEAGEGVERGSSLERELAAASRDQEISTFLTLPFCRTCTVQ